MKSWFYDQVLHPHETQHTAAEISRLLQTLNVDNVRFRAGSLISSIDIDEAKQFDEDLRRMGIDRLMKETYFPGFFVISGIKSC